MKKLLYLVLSVFIIACNNDDNDSTAPVVTLIGESSITVSQSSTYVDAGATATDNQDGDLTSSIVTTSNVDTSILGTYTVVHSVSDAAGNVGSASRQVDVGVPTPSVDINVLWQDKPGHDTTSTTVKVAAINPDKFIISIEGPYSNSSATTGPTPTQLVSFIHSLTQTNNYHGKLVMHLDTSAGDFESTWTSPPVPWDSASSWTLFADYFIHLNDILKDNNLPRIKELLIETGNGTVFANPPGTPASTEAADRIAIFTKFRTYIHDNQTSTNKFNFTLSATSNWQDYQFPDTADYYYAQMYDMCYLEEPNWPLCGVNTATTNPAIVDTLVSHMMNYVKKPSPPISEAGLASGSRLDSVSFIFTYAPLKSGEIPGEHSPMFGEVDVANAYWNKTQFTNFAKEFKIKLQHPNASTGIWHCEGPLGSSIWNH